MAATAVSTTSNRADRYAGLDPPFMPDQCGQRQPERLGLVGYQLTEPHPFGRVTGLDQGHLPRVGGLDLGQRIRALRGQGQRFAGQRLGPRDAAGISFHRGQLGEHPGPKVSPRRGDASARWHRRDRTSAACG